MSSLEAPLESSAAGGMARPDKRTGGRRRPALWLIVPGIAYLIAFLVVPMLQLLWISFAGTEAQEGPFGAYLKLWNSTAYMRVMGTTFVIAIENTLLCLTIAYPLAYWLARLPQRRRNVMILLVLLPFWTSSLVKNFIWLVLLGRTGVAVDFLLWLGFPAGTELLFTRGAVLFGMVHTMLPLAVLTMLPTMLSIDRRLPLAAATLGASPSHAFWRIYLPLSMPGVAAAGLLVMVISLGFFITPALLGSPRDTMIGQVIISQILTFQNWSFGGAVTTVLVVATLTLCVAYNWLFGLTAVSSSSGGRPPNPLVHRHGTALLKLIAGASAALFDRRRARPMLPGRSGRLQGLYAALVIGILILPIVLLVPMAFTRSTFLEFPPPLGSTRWFSAYLDSPIWIAATFRSFLIGIVCALAAFALTFTGAFGIARAGGRIAAAAFLLFLAPMIIPSIAISLSLFYLFSQVGLVATDTGIVIGHVVLAIPTVFVITLATMKSYDWRLNDAAATLGAGRWRTTWRITLPLMKGGLLAAAIFGFLISFEELTVVMFVGAGFKVTVPKQMWDDIQLQLTPTLAAASAVVLLIVTVLFLAGEFLHRRSKGGQS